MFTIRAEEGFAAAHYIKNYHGKCENLHGHNYRVRAYVKGRKTGKGGMVLDFSILKKLLKNVLAELDHKNLNDHPFFDKTEPSAEMIAQFIFEKIESQFPETEVKCRLFRVDVFETEKNLAIYERDDDI